MSGSQSALIGGGLPPTAIANYYSAGGVSGVAMMTTAAVKKTLSGALTANTLKTMLSISGGGAIKFLGLQTQDATSRTIRMKVTIDGAVAFDATSSAITATEIMQIAVGGISYNSGGYVYPMFERVPFNSSLLVEIASSLSETDKLALCAVYETR